MQQHRFFHPIVVVIAITIGLSLAENSSAAEMPRAATLARWVDETAVAVVFVDLSRSEPEFVGRGLRSLLQLGFANPQQKAMDEFNQSLHSLKQAGVRHACAV